LSKRGSYNSPTARYYALLEGALAHIEWAKSKIGPEPLQHIKDAKAYLASTGKPFHTADYMRAVMNSEPLPESATERAARLYTEAQRARGPEKERLMKLAMEAAAEDTKFPGGFDPSEDLI
jgi:hypothetical protein